MGAVVGNARAALCNCGFAPPAARGEARAGRSRPQASPAQPSRGGLGRPEWSGRQQSESARASARHVGCVDAVHEACVSTLRGEGTSKKRSEDCGAIHVPSRTAASTSAFHSSFAYICLRKSADAGGGEKFSSFPFHQFVAAAACVPGLNSASRVSTVVASSFSGKPFFTPYDGEDRKTLHTVCAKLHIR